MTVAPCWEAYQDYREKWEETEKRNQMKALRFQTGGGGGGGGGESDISGLPSRAAAGRKVLSSSLSECDSITTQGTI